MEIYSPLLELQVAGSYSNSPEQQRSNLVNYSTVTDFARFLG
jgi:hypothetical protein